MEQHTIKMHKFFSNVYVECKSVPNPVNFFINNEVLKQQRFLGKNSKTFSSCCLNSTHLLEAFGKCNSTRISSISSKHYLFGNCSEFYLQTHIAFVFRDDCLEIIKFNSPCDNYETPVKTYCTDRMCNKII